MNLFPATPRELARIAESPYTALNEAIEMLTNITCGHSYDPLDFQRRLTELAYTAKGYPRGK